MKNNKCFRFKILLVLILLVILSAITYISLPYISYALESTITSVTEAIGKINSPANSITMNKEQIQEHRGYGIIASWHSKTEKKTYDQAAGNTGISTTQMQSYIKTNLSPYIPLNTSLGWVNSLLLNTSIFCVEEGVPFPGLNARVFNAYHVSQDTETYKFKDNKKIQDYIEWNPNLVCKEEIEIYKENYKDGGVELITAKMDEGDVWFASGFKYVMDEFRKVTTVRVRYTAYPKDFDTAESYIFSYSLRNYYTYNPAQIALWKYENDVWVTNKYYCDADTIAKAKRLYNSAMAVQELSNPTKPQIYTSSVTDSNGLTYSTGTILDGNYYKVGPFKMNGYSYGWTADAKEFSGDSSVKNPKNTELLANKNATQIDFFKGVIAGIVEARLKLDNGKDEIILTKDNFIVEGGNTNSGSSYYSYPKMADGYEYPTPNSTFYIKIPISSCVGATSVEKITMKYKWHTADGNGGYLDGYYDELLWSTREADGGIYTVDHNDSTTYKCDHSYDGYECIHDSLPWNGVESSGASKSTRNVSSCWYGYGWDEYDVNFFSHDFWCDGSEDWCKYGSSASVTYYADVSPGSTRYTNKITTSCSSTWNCGYYAHDHGNSLSSYQKNDGDYHEACICSHTHYSSCFKFVCTKSEHKHTKANGCYHSHEGCTKGEDGKYTCGKTTSTKECTKTAHTHDSWGVNSDCHEKICGHTPGTTCSKLSGGTYGCCKYYEHTHSISSCGKSHDCTTNYCIHGFANGKHTCQVDTSHTGTSCDGRDWGYTHIGNCYGPPGEGTRCNAHPDADGGGHRNCATFYWFLIKETVMDVQKLMYVSDAQVYEHNEECYIEKIPLVAKVEIDKYIYDVEHAKTGGNLDNSYAESDVRRGLDEDTKENNPVYVEKDDFVTYKIVIKNSSAFGVKVKVDDVLPVSTAYEFVSARLGTEVISDLSKLRQKTIQIDKESEASITITLQVKVLEGKYENLAKIITRNGNVKNTTDDIDYIRTVDDNGPVVNHISTTCNGTTDTPEWESSDWFILNNYNSFIDKYVYKYDEAKQKENNNTLLVTNEESIVGSNNILKETRLNTNKVTTTVSDGNVVDTIRIDDGRHEAYKAAHPVNVEKYEKVTYAIRVSNEATDVTKNHVTGLKPATQFKPTLIVDKLHNGLQYKSITAKIYNKDGTVKQTVLGIGCSLVDTEGEYNVYHITTTDSTIINPGEYIEFYMVTSVVQSNMYLHAMNNSAKLEKISNINDVDVTTRNISTQKETTEYIRLKDLVIAGRVWLDIDKDGYMNDSARSELEKVNHNINNEAMKERVEVRLYQVDAAGNATKVRTTKTDENGLYTFGRNSNLNWYTTYNNTKDYSATTKYQRIDKASNKDSNGNYTASSEYYKYYVEFAYDGVVYKSTEVYSGVNNLTENDGRFNEKYPIDSNAAEFEIDRERFNVKHDIISYNVSYDTGMNKTADLTFQKDGHQSYLIEDPEREVTSKSFILKYNTQQVLKACKTAMNSCGSYYWKSCSNHWDEWQVVIAMGLIDEAAYPNTTNGRKAAQEYLKGIYNTLEKNAATSGNTQMIKYLWLYSFHSEIDRTTPETEYLKYINLGLELREDVDLALSKDVYNVKTTINGEEMEYDYNLGDTPNYLNSYIVKQPYGFEIYESDYKYRVEQYIAHAVEAYKGIHGEDELNVEVTFRINLQNVATTDDDSIAKAANKKINVKVHEVLDLYDTNFMKYAENAIKMKVKNAKGLLVDKSVDVVEAWMFMTKSEAKGKTLLDGGQTYSTRASNGGNKPIYVPDDAGNFVKVKLEVSNASRYSGKTNNFTADGYNTLYIRGMEGQVISEGGNIDIYVKYIVDKAKLEVDIDKATYEETSKIKTSTEKVNDNITNVITVIEGSTKAAIERSLKLAEKINTTFKNANGRGTENIAQINAYSTWYTNGKPASLVDKDSNAGNIGVKNDSTDKSPKRDEYSESMTSADDTRYYEDMTYKTGIELVANATENTKQDVKDKYGKIIITQNSEPLRKITGTVWDDSRTNTLGTGTEIQYIGDGKYDTSKTKHANAKYNDNVSLNYKGENVTENTDIKVRNAKAEFIEIIQTDDKHYYEEVLTNVTWKQKQYARTNDNGDYTLEGFKPGTYIVRFTYGDTVKDATAKKDMLIFNGQDYKSTQYTGVPDTLKDVDAVIKSFEKEGVSDARDDEVRRLEVNAYSEVMTNEIAEILKGTANGTKLTPNSTANTPEELQALTDNTYMIADTREFLVKAEKLTSTQTEFYSEDDIYYNKLEALMNRHINEREFTISHVDLGIEYRPESEISLMKEINEITLITEDGETLVNLHFYTVDKGNDRVHYIDKDKSTGEELVQFITNNYTTEALLNKIVTEKLQGLVYIQVDEEILQGCTVKITYGFNAQNYSEIDRISTKLNAIRYRDNKATDDAILAYQNKYKDVKPEVLVSLDSVINTKYTASAMSKALVYADTYGIDGQGIVFREIPKTTTTTGNDGYYGRYVGYGYYTGKASGLDTVSMLKFDKILDYIDTSLEYEQKSAYEDTVNKLWGKITSKELVQLVYHLRDYRELVNIGAATQETLPKVTDTQGIEYRAMVVSIDDRNVDPGDPNDVDVVRNQELARFLEPKAKVVGLNGTDQDTDAAGRRRYTGTITLDVSKVLAAGSDDDDKTYENMAEIVQFTTLNGRRTNFATTIGNADIHTTKDKVGNANSGSVEFMTASIESDTSATETITLIPPTGLMKSRRPIISIMETVKVGVEVMSMAGLIVAIVAVVIVIVLFIIRKYRKRRIR